MSIIDSHRSEDHQHIELKLNDGITNTTPALVGEVKTLQQRLKDWGVLAPTEPVDGEFGPNTEKAVKLFQDKHGLDIDGVVGRQTWAELLKIEPGQVVLIPRPAATVGNLNEAIVRAAKSLRGMSTANDGTNGERACAWVVNRVLEKAAISTLGDNPVWVPDLKAALEAGRGQRVPSQDAEPGNLVIAYGEEHIGICLGNGQVLSNSSSYARFQWLSNVDFDGSYGGPSAVYRLLR